MTQSVELLLDPAAEAAVHDQWVRLAEAGLPSALRTPAPPHHRPHITLWAGASVPVGAEAAWVELMTGLDLSLVVGSWLVFGPRRGRCVLVRQVVPTVALLDLQRAVAEVAEADSGGFFGPGRWSPHVTVSPRIATHQLGAGLAALEGSAPEIPTRVTDCRRWDGEARTAWSLTTPSGSFPTS